MWHLINILKSGVPTQVKVIYGKQGLIYLDTSYQYDFITKEDVKDKVISYDTAVNIAMTKYDYVSEQNIIQGRITIYISGNRWQMARLQYQI